METKVRKHQQLNSCDDILVKAAAVVNDQIRRLEVEQLILKNKLSQIRKRKMQIAEGEEEEDEEERKRTKRTPNHSIAVSPHPQLQLTPASSAESQQS